MCEWVSRIKLAYDRYLLKFVISDIFKFYNNQCPDDDFNEIFYPVDDGIATCCCNKKSKLPFRMTKLGMQSLLLGLYFLEQTPQ